MHESIAILLIVYLFITGWCVVVNDWFPKLKTNPWIWPVDFIKWVFKC